MNGGFEAARMTAVGPMLQHNQPNREAGPGQKLT